jgi:hypothetical protein
MICDIDSNTFEMSQPFFICRILELLSLDEHKTKGHNTPVGKPLLHCDLDGVPPKHPWLYCSAVGMLSYLGNSVRPKIQMAVHQTARFSVNPMRLHELAIMRLGGYLCNNANTGLSTKLINQKELKFTLMQILQENIVLLMQTMLTMYHCGLVLLYAMQTVL